MRAHLTYSDRAIGMPDKPWRPYNREASRAMYLRAVCQRVEQVYPGVTIVAVYVNDAQRLAVVMEGDDGRKPGQFRVADGIRSIAWDIGEYGFDGWAVPVVTAPVSVARPQTRRVVLWQCEEHGASTDWTMLEEEHFRDANDITA